MIYDALHPAPGVRVSSVPRPKVHISASQLRAARTPETNHKGEFLGVLRPIMQGGAVGLGMVSTVVSAKCLSQVIESRKGCAPGTVRPGSRRRGHKKRPSNLSFGRMIPTNYMYHKAEGQKRLKSLMGFHSHLMGRQNCPHLETKYEHTRAVLLHDYPELQGEISRIEQQHIQRIAPRQEVA